MHDNDIALHYNALQGLLVALYILQDVLCEAPIQS